MTPKRRKELEEELSGIIDMINPFVPAMLDSKSPGIMSLPELEAEELDRLRARREEIHKLLDEDVA